MYNTYQKRPKGLGEVEQMVMDYVWAHGPCPAESCREALAAARPMKDSTVRTILRRLEQKGFVTHEIEGRTYIYRAAEARQNVAVRAVKSIIDRFCGGSAEELVVGMVNSAVIDRNLLDRLARKVAQGKTGEKLELRSENRPSRKGK
jgi:BlaI family transcriptional regulator, penicillinase repressor